MSEHKTARERILAMTPEERREAHDLKKHQLPVLPRNFETFLKELIWFQMQMDPKKTESGLKVAMLKLVRAARRLNSPNDTSPPDPMQDLVLAQMDSQIYNTILLVAGADSVLIVRFTEAHIDRRIQIFLRISVGEDMYTVLLDELTSPEERFKPIL